MRLILPLCLLLTATALGKPTWKAGAASEKITPETLMWMAGYASRNKPAEGVEQDLYAKALVIEDAGGGKFALITMDLIGVPRALRLHVARLAEEKYGIEPARLAINASHTHSGPELRVHRTDRTDAPGEREAEAIAYVEKLQDTLVRLIGEAAGKMVDAELHYGSARCGFSMNRRTPDGAGWKNFPNPQGPVDQTVPVLKVSSEGADIAYIFGYACHCTTLGHQKFSGDYAGYAQEALQAAHPGVIAMFMNGCSGDQNPYPRRETAWAQTHGKTLATAVEAALTTNLRPIGGPIRAAYKEIPLAYDELPSREQLLETQKSKTKLDADHARRMLALLDKNGSFPQDYPYPVQVVRLGSDLTWVNLAGEVVVDYSLRLKREIQDPIVWVSGYTNDVPTYIPSLRIWQEGGYEGGGAMKWNLHPTRWSPKVEEHIISTVMELRKQVE